MKNSLVLITLLSALAAPAMAATFTSQWVPATAPGPALPNAKPGGAPPGLYVQVLDGMVTLTNAGGAQNFAAGQFGYTPSPQQPPVIVPRNPALTFAPPPAFSSPNPVSASGPSKPQAVDCEVR